MGNVKETIRQNLVTLRKEHKLTQLELAERIGYSDKAISRWETGEVTPDVETLSRIAELYGIEITVLFEPYEKEAFQKKRFRDMDIGKKIAVALLSVAVLWYLGIMWFIYRNTSSEGRHWLIFIWLIPATFILGLLFNIKWGTKLLTCILASGLCWSLLTALYLEFLDQNIYMLFISGVPVEAALVLWSYIRPPKKSEILFRSER